MTFDLPVLEMDELVPLHDFGLMGPDELKTCFENPETSREYFRKYKQAFRATKDGAGAKLHKNKFQVNLDVKDFTMDDLLVKVVNGCIIIEAKHNERKDDDGWLSRTLVRRYPLPTQCNIQKMVARLSEDGVLMVKVPRKVIHERQIPILKVRIPSEKSEEASKPNVDEGAAEPAEDAQANPQ